MANLKIRAWQTGNRLALSQIAPQRFHRAGGLAVAVCTPGAGVKQLAAALDGSAGAAPPGLNLPAPAALPRGGPPAGHHRAGRVHLRHPCAGRPVESGAWQIRPAGHRPCHGQRTGLDGDLLDAVVLGPRLAVGTRVSVKVWGAVTLVDRGMADDKLVCSAQPVTAAQWRHLRWYFGFYSVCKCWLNRWRGLPGRNACEGWRSATAALARASQHQQGPLPGRKSPP